MKWLLSAHKATQRLIISQQYHFHGDYYHRHFHASNPIGSPKFYQMQYLSSLILGRYYNTSTTLNIVESSYRLPDDNKNKLVDLEIISKESIKPSSPTPHHLRTYNLSIIDQCMFDTYTPLILFIPNSDNTSVMEVETKRSKHIKETLSKILTRFYPFAGKIKDNMQIECNDEGVYYIEARVKQKLQDFLCEPDDEKVRELIPESPCTAESSIGNYVVGIQVNIFLCGGIAISTSLSHKIFDGHTYYMFMKAWAAAARGSPEIVSPCFVASEIFPNNPCLKHESLSSKLPTTKMVSTKRFVFDSTALALLKAQPIASLHSTHGPTRMEATSAVVWKTAAKAASQVRPIGSQSPHAFGIMVNLRKKTSPPLPNESVGNIIDGVVAICYPERQMDLPTMMGDLRESIAKITSDHIESMKGEKGHKTYDGILRRSKQLEEVTGGWYMLSTSLLNSGMYDLDFGWAKPIWFYAMNGGQSNSFLALNDTPKNDGVEAIVTLRKEEMEIFECDPELLSYAIVNPSPLRFLKH